VLYIMLLISTCIDAISLFVKTLLPLKIFRKFLFQNIFLNEFFAKLSFVGVSILCTIFRKWYMPNSATMHWRNPKVSFANLNAFE